MPTATGRNTRAENIWRAITNFFTRSAPAPTGQTAPLAQQYGGSFSSQSALSRRYDQEYVELPIRDFVRARQLIELRKRPEVATALDILVGDLFSSEDGDDYGFTIGETLIDGSPVDPSIRAICMKAIERLLTGGKITTIAEEFLAYGDSFRSLVVDPSYTQIQKLKQLPTWEMFRVEDQDGNILRFEQRRRLTEETAEFTIHPMLCVHWRFRPLYKYGRSLFDESLEDSAALEQGYFAVEKAAMAIGVNPNVHVMPPGWTKPQADAYKQSYEAERDRNGRVMTDFFMLSGGEVKKLSQTWNPDLKALTNNVDQRRARIAMRSRIPPWMIGLATIGAREISGQPAMAYARFLGAVRMTLAEGIRQILDTELAMNGYSKDQMNYRILFPKIYTNTQAQSNSQTDEPIPDAPPDGITWDRNRFSTLAHFQ